MSELFGANMSQVDMLELLLDALPGQMDGVMVPIHPKARRPWAAALVARGVRVDPEAMEQFPIPGDHPEAGWMNPHKWVSKAEYDEYAATRPDDMDAASQMQQMLQAVNPTLAQRMSSMTPEERAAEASNQAQRAQDLMARMHEVGRQHWERQQGTQSPPEER